MEGSWFLGDPEFATVLAPFRAGIKSFAQRDTPVLGPRIVSSLMRTYRSVFFGPAMQIPNRRAGQTDKASSGSYPTVSGASRFVPMRDGNPWSSLIRIAQRRQYPPNAARWAFLFSRGL
jgi:hypothetical protein